MIRVNVETLCLRPLQAKQTCLTMLRIARGNRDIWIVLLLVLCHRLLMANVDQYHAVSKDAFRAVVAYKCECHVSHSNRATKCALLSSLLAPPHCLGTALAPGFCWLCGEDFAEIYLRSAMNATTQFWQHSGRRENNMLRPLATL